MVEYSEEMGNDVFISKPVAVGENIVFRGEDFSSQKPALHAGTRISSRGMGVLAACGKSEVPVSEKPLVAIISTGNEIVSVSDVPKAGQIRDVNTYLCAGFVEESGGIPISIGIVRDDRPALAGPLTLLSKALIFRGQNTLYDPLQILRRKGLGDKIGSSSLNSLDSLIDGAVRSDHNNGGIDAALLNLSNQLQPRHLRHALVGNYDIESVFFQL